MFLFFFLYGLFCGHKSSLKKNKQQKQLFFMQKQVTISPTGKGQTQGVRGDVVKILIWFVFL